MSPVQILYCVPCFQVEFSCERISHTGKVSTHKYMELMNIYIHSCQFRPQGKMPSPGSGVKENGGHIITTSHLTPPTQAPPTSTPPSLAPPPPTTSSSPLTPPSSHSELSSSETLPPSTPSQSPGSNQTTSSDDIVTDKIIDKTSEGVTPPISSERDVESHTSVGEPSTSEKVCTYMYMCNS